jgi:hypothetical protein
MQMHLVYTERQLAPGRQILHNKILRDVLLLKFLADSGGHGHGIYVSHEFRKIYVTIAISRSLL